MPVKLSQFPLVSTSQGIMAIGGMIYNDRYQDEILTLKCEDGKEDSEWQWKEYPKKLDVARDEHVVIPLPDSFEICNN